MSYSDQGQHVAEPSIFKEPEPVVKAKTDTRDALSKATSHFHRAPEGNEPDWRGQLLNAKNEREKWAIRAAKEAWQAEQKLAAHQAAQTVMNSRIEAATKAPVTRNKGYWEALQRSDGRVFWSVECQRQMKADKATLGLSWYSKAP